MRRYQLALLAGAGVGAASIGWLERFRQSRASRCVTIQEHVPADPAALFERLRDVEAEPRLVPGVEAVTVLERGDSFVGYRVEGRLCGTPWWVVFRKEWEQAPGTLTWESEDGTFGIRQVGHLSVEAEDGGSLVTVVACTRFDQPLIGPLATLTCGPCYLEGAFRTWLGNAAREADGPGADLNQEDIQTLRGSVMREGG
jgi:hypothetical protein